jgi:hypothetical protein
VDDAAHEALADASSALISPNSQLSDREAPPKHPSLTLLVGQLLGEGVTPKRFLHDGDAQSA